jgi:dTDP-4-dehydrorhamnose reductase
MKVLITGGSGLLGGYIQDELENHVNPLSYESVEYYAPSSHECNVMSKESVSRSFYSYNPDIVIHCAAIAKFKDVDKNPQKALMVNVTGTCNIIGQCEAGSLGRTDDGVKLVYISTDHVFDGMGGLYDTHEKINPISRYAKMKAAGELSVLTYRNPLVIRTSFCPEKFPFDTAYVDKYTSQDYVDLVAPKIVDAALSDQTGIINIGHKRRSFYELAKERNPNIKKGSISEVMGPVLIDTSLKV